MKLLIKYQAIVNQGEWWRSWGVTFIKTRKWEGSIGLPSRISGGSAFQRCLNTIMLIDKPQATLGPIENYP